MMHVLVHHAPDLALQTELISKGESQLFLHGYVCAEIDRYLKSRLPDTLLFFSQSRRNCVFVIDPLDQSIQPTSQEFIRVCILRTSLPPPERNVGSCRVSYDTQLNNFPAAFLFGGHGDCLSSRVGGYMYCLTYIAWEKNGI